MPFLVLVLFAALAPISKADILGAHPTTIWDVEVSNDGALILSSDADGLVRVWDRVTKVKLDEYRHDSDFKTYDASFFPDNFRIISCNRDGGVFVRDTRLRRTVYTFSRRAGYSARCLVDPTGQYIAVTRSDDSVKIFDANTYRDVTAIGSNQANAVRFVQHNKKLSLVVSDLDGLKVYDTTSWNHKVIETGFSTFSLAATKDGKLISAGRLTQGHGIRVWDANSLVQVDEFAQPKGIPWQSQSSNSDRFVLSVALNGSVYVYDLESSSNLVTIPAQAIGADFVPGKRQIVVGNEKDLLFNSY